MPTVSVGSAGVSQTWNMAALNTHSVDTLNFIPNNAGWIPDATTFSTANLVIQFGVAPNYAYALNNASGLSILGNIATVDLGAGPVDLKQFNTPAEKLITFPSTYSTTFTNNVISNATVVLGIDPGVGFVIDSVHIKTTIDKTNLCDAWGNITTPLGTYASLRYHETKTQRDSIFGLVGGFGWIFFQENFMYTNRYNWWANGIGFPLVDVTMDSLGTMVQRVNWLQALPAVGINEVVSSVDVNVYPNPANNEIYFEMNSTDISFVEVFDIAGRMIERVQIDADKTKLDVTKYSNGIYSYSIVSSKNAILNHGKFTLVK